MRQSRVLRDIRDGKVFVIACGCHMLATPPWKALPTETTSIRVVGWHRPGGPPLLHISNILSKLGENDRAQAVTIALQRGIIELAVRQR